MGKNITPNFYKLADLPEFQRFDRANPQNYNDEHSAALNFGRAIHWLSILEILWPDFENNDCYFIEVKHIVCNDPEKHKLPEAFYKQISEMIHMFWTMKLEQLYPDGDWTVEFFNDDEMTIQATIRRRQKLEE